MDKYLQSSALAPEALCVHLCQWSGGRLLVVLRNLGIDNDLARSADAFLEVYKGDCAIASFSCSYTGALGGLWGSAIELTAISKTFNERAVETLTFRLKLERASKTWLSAPLNRRGQHPAAFAEFTADAFLDDNIIAIPDETAEADYVLRIIGWKGDASHAEYARTKKDRHYKNLILLKSLSMGPGVTHAIAASFSDKELEPHIAFSRSGMPWAVFDKLDKKLRFNLSGAKQLSNITLFDEGKRISQCVAGHWVGRELEILMKPIIEFDALCKAHGIEYMAGFGTLLGAVRHNGVIPWDHDVDLYITQKNYLKLRHLFDSGQMPDNLRLDDWMSVPGYPGPLGRLNDVSGVKLNARNAYGHADLGSFGIAFDIFPLLPVKGTRNDAEKLRATAIAFWEIENRVARSKLIRTNAVISEYMRLMGRCEAEGRKKVLDEIREQIYSTPDDEADYYIVGVSGQRNSFIFKKDWIYPLIQLPFNEMTMPCPHDYFKVLREIYGPNFRKYPDGKERKPKRYSHLRSFDLPYETVRQTYLEDSNCTVELENRSKLKDLRMREAVERCYETKAVGEIRAIMLQANARDKYDALNLSERKAGNYRKIDRAYTSFFNLQLREKPLTWRIPIKIESKYLAIAIEDLLCYRGESGDAAQILSIRFDNTDNPDEPIDDILRKAYDATWHTIEMRDCYEYGKIDEAIALARSVLADYPFAIEPRCLLTILEAADEHDQVWREEKIAELEEETVRTNSLLPFVLETSLLFETKRADAALAFYHMIMRDFNDGMAMNYLQEKMEEAFRNGD